LVAIFSVHLKHGFFAMSNGIELPFLYAVSALALAFSGPGSLSLDSVLGLGLFHDRLIVGAF
jgi:putative oxidoreductase